MSARARVGWALRGAATVFEIGRRLGPAALLPVSFGGPLEPERADCEHLDAAIGWLCRAQDACGGRGVSAQQLLGYGWWEAYPETTGYIIGTFLAMARHSGDPGLRERALRMGDWELEILAPNDGVISAPSRPVTRVFNTGQVILGWCALEEELHLQRHLAGAARAGRYMLALQEDDGRWERDTHSGPRTYYARASWGLLRLAALTGERRFAEGAARHLAWVLRQATPNGWFANCGFGADLPITHVIGYTLRGLLECHALGDPATRGLDLLGPVLAAADSLMQVIERASLHRVPGLLPASFAADWSSPDRYSCLTGNAQLSIVFARLAQLGGRADHARAARTLASAAKRTQRLRAPSPAVRGALAGSHPLTGTYCRYSFPNWAAKFFADALLFQLHPEQGFNVVA